MGIRERKWPTPDRTSCGKRRMTTGEPSGADSRRAHLGPAAAHLQQPQPLAVVSVAPEPVDDPAPGCGCGPARRPPPGSHVDRAKLKRPIDSAIAPTYQLGLCRGSGSGIVCSSPITQRERPDISFLSSPSGASTSIMRSDSSITRVPRTERICLTSSAGFGPGPRNRRM